MYENRAASLWTDVRERDTSQEDPMTAPQPAQIARAELADAVDASRIAVTTAERELRRSVVARSRAAEALERTARMPGLDEDERARRRADYTAADRAVAERRAAADRARDLARAAAVVADAFETEFETRFETEAASASRLAGALIDLVGSARGTGPRARTALAAARRATASARLRNTRPRTA